MPDTAFHPNNANQRERYSILIGKDGTERDANNRQRKASSELETLFLFLFATKTSGNYVDRCWQPISD